MRIDPFLLPPIGTNAYLLSDAERGEAILIDAPAEALEAIEPHLKANELTLLAVLLTHGHFDHILGAAALQRAGFPIYAHPDDQEMIARLGEQVAMFGIPAAAEVPTIDHWIEPRKNLRLLGRDIDVRHTPGHCPGNVTFYFAAENLAFVGDVIFAGGVGRTDLPGGNPTLLEHTIREQIYSLPNQTTLYPGHGPITTVRDERATNPFVRG